MWERYKRKIDQYLKQHLPEPAGQNRILYKAIRYSTVDGGKRIRPILCIGGFEAGGGRGDYIVPIACAIELVHTFSLVHDDLPCMDNDDTRRGKPTSHKVFGEDVAMLAGDALLTMAFEWIAGAPKISTPQKIKIIKELSQNIVGEGLIEGQILDLRTPPEKLSPKTIKTVYLKKTAALITGSVRIGAILAGVSKPKLKLLTGYGKDLGVAFQIVDDLLDIAQDTKKKQNISYPLSVGTREAYNCARGLIRSAVDSLKPFGKKSGLLQEIAEWIITQVPATLTDTVRDRGPSNSAK